jgi:uncharacterized RDD family membrane protein YckC
MSREEWLRSERHIDETQRYLPDDPRITSPPVPWKRRAAALLIDVALVAVLMLLLSPRRDAPPADSAARVMALLLGLLMGAFWLMLYYTLATTVWGRTLGKRLLGLRVITREGKSPDLECSVRRTWTLAKEIGPPPLVVVHAWLTWTGFLTEGYHKLISVLLVLSLPVMLGLLWETRRRPAHDAKTGTYVIQE